MIWLSRIFIGWMNWFAPLYGRKRVASIETRELARRLETHPDSVVLVDVRSQRETDVSMIPGAITRETFLADREQMRDRLVIPYCTVGGRSLLFAQRCARDGFEVRNYQGSILDWCASGNPLVDPDGCQTRRVHTHNRWFDAPDGYQSVRGKHPPNRPRSGPRG